MSISELYESRKNNPNWNTSYPISPADWTQYRVNHSLSFTDNKDMCFYVHIPFCRQLCSFCEYTRTVCPDSYLQRKYIEALSNDIRNFKRTHKNFILHGFDIGGGTPTALDDENFSLLMGIYSESLEDLVVSRDFDPSIEATFQTVSEHKLELIVNNGIKRLSLGIQSSDNRVLSSVSRNPNTLENMESVLQYAYACGVKIINLDFMYGLQNQTLLSIKYDLETIRALSPEQVTLYELRPNMLLNNEYVMAEHRYNCYKEFYNGLVDMGYKSFFGQNTFSKNPDDMGLSSYIRHRMTDFMPYKGFGISAQSMNGKGLSYNIGKNNKNINGLLERESFDEEYTYVLPSQELAAKYIAVSAYSGCFSLSKLSEIIGDDAKIIFRDQIEFCINNNLIQLQGDTIRITENGFKYYGDVFSLFHTYNNFNNNIN